MNSVNNEVTCVLDGSNYNYWRQEMISFLQSRGLYKYVTDRAAKLLEQYEKISKNFAKAEEVREGDEKALGFIKRSIKYCYVDVIVDCTTALDAWTKLETFFAGKETSNSVSLVKQLINSKLKESANPVIDVQEFVQTNNDLVKRLNVSGMKLTEELQVSLMLAQLPDSYEAMGRIFEAQGELTVIRLSTELNKEAIRKQEKKRSFEESVLAASHRFESGPPTKRPRNRSRSFKSCTYCEATGHVMETCWFNPKSPKYRPELVEKVKKLGSMDASSRLGDSHQK